MSDLRREVRLAAERGTQLYATVEAVIKGEATVRLANGGARMTSLPIVGAAVTVGETVIVDYSGEGKPFVRPLTQPYEDVELTPLDVSTGEIEESVDEGLEIARITLSAPYTQNTGWTCAAGCYPIAHYLRLDKVIYDPLTMKDGYGLRPKTPGRYLLKWAVAIGPPYGPYGQGIRLSMNATYSGSRIGATRWRRWRSNSDNDWVLMSGSTIATVNDPADGVFYLRVAPEWGTQIVVGDEPSAPYTILVDEGRYPILEIYKICGLGSGDKAASQWWYYE